MLPQQHPMTVLFVNRSGGFARRASAFADTPTV